MNILTAQQFITQGTSAGAVLSIADALDIATAERPARPDLAARVRKIAEEVARITGQRLQVPGAVTHEREMARYQRRRRLANDNRVQRRAA